MESKGSSKAPFWRTRLLCDASPNEASPTQKLQPLGTVVTSSDKIRTRALLNLSVTDQCSLALVSEGLQRLGLPRIMVKVIMDCTENGGNAAVAGARFTYPGLCSGIDMVERGSFLGIYGVSKYIHSFPWAVTMRDKMRNEWERRLYKC